MISLVALVGLSACGSGVIQRVDAPPSPPPGSGALRVIATPASAVIYVDGEYRGAINRYRDGWVAIERGRRRIAIKAKNHYTWYEVVEIGNTPKEREVRLIERPATGD